MRKPKEQNPYPSSSRTDEYTFENFIVGSSNKFAHAAAVAVASFDAKEAYNPLLIYGDSGLGKTHLIYAINHYYGEKFPQLKTIIIKGDDYANELVSAIKSGELHGYREKYQTADVLLIDDVHFLEGKTATQEEFLNTISALHELGKRIVIVSGKPPAKIPRLEDWLKRRFESGLIVDIQPPDDALRVAIIKEKAGRLGIALPDDAVDYIAKNLHSNISQLEGAVKTLKAKQDSKDETITVDFAKKHLMHLIKH